MVGSLSDTNLRLRAAARFVREALSHCTWRLGAVAILIGLARNIPRLYGWLVSGGDLEFLVWRTLVLGFAVCFVLIAVLLAEHGVRAGARRFPTYAIALFVASACAGILPKAVFLSSCNLDWFCFPGFQPGDSLHLGGVLFNGVDTLGRGGLAAYIYANREQMLRSMRELGAAQLARAETEKKLAQAQLQALQARVDPTVLFDTLNHTQRLYLSDAAAADRRLEELIEQLRAATRQVQI